MSSTKLIECKGTEAMKLDLTIEELRINWLQNKPETPDPINKIDIKLKSWQEELEEKFEEATKKLNDLTVGWKKKDSTQSVSKMLRTKLKSFLWGW